MGMLGRLVVLPLAPAFASFAFARSQQADALSRAADPEALTRLDIVRGTVESLSIPIDVSRGFGVSVRLGGTAERIELYPYSLRARSYRAVTDVSARSTDEAPASPPATLRGTVAGRPESAVAATAFAGELRALIRLGPHDPVWVIQPHPLRERHHALVEHVIFSSRDIAPVAARCGLVDVDSLFASAVPNPPTVPFLKTAEIVLDSDNEYVADFLVNNPGASCGAVIVDMEGVLNATDLIFDLQTGIRYAIRATIVRSITPLPPGPSGSPVGLCSWGPDPFSAATDSTQALTNMQSAWNAAPSPYFNGPRDIVQLFTGRDLTAPGIGNNSIGIASIGTVCNPSSCYSITESLFSQNFALRVALCAHELAHNWGALHCQNTGFPCGIMCSMLTLPPPTGCNGDFSTFGDVPTLQILAGKDAATCLDSHSPDLASCSASLMPGGLPGPSGLPSLSESGSLTAGSAVSIQVSGAPASSAGLWVLSPSANPVPTPFGGTLVPTPPLIALPFSTSSSGAAALPLVWPSGVPFGATAYLQAWVVGSGAVPFVVGSNGLALMTPLLDPFNGANGSPPDPLSWQIIPGCPTSTVTIQNDRLEVGSVIAGGCSGSNGQYASALTAAGQGFGGFDVSLRLIDVFVPITNSSGCYFGFGVFDADPAALPPATSGPAAFATFTLSASCWDPLNGCASPFGVQATSGPGQTNLLNSTVVFGDTLRLVGRPGGSLVFLVNGVPVFTNPAWTPTSSQFRVWIWAWAGPTTSFNQVTTVWDNLILCGQP